MTRRVLLLPLLAAFAALPLLAGDPAPAQANHSWANYHWARTSNPFTLKVGDNVNSTWDPYLNEAIADWTASEVLNLTKVTGATTSLICRATNGRIEACNARYGYNGWLGIAQIWINGDHITKALTKVNDTYFNTATYNKPAWRRLVMCQEIAHDFGLDHQDENFSNPNLGSCMDYTDDPDGGAGGASSNDPSNEHPNAHDFAQLEKIYDPSDGGHTDSTTTIALGTTSNAPGRSGTAAEEGPNNPDDFGRPAGPKDGHGRDIVYTKDVGNGQKLVTHVTWALPNTGPGTRPSR
jgi:hypothetical protein